MAPRLLKPVLCWLCLYSVHGQGNVTGPAFLVTDGTRYLTLTCQVSNDSMVDRYEWFTPVADTKRCGTTQAPNVCTFEPVLTDDNQNVICKASNSTGDTLARAVYTVNLKYPPESSPSITTGSPQTNTVRQGDDITCTVTGGKPRVTNVTFHCQHPDLADREDDVSDDGTVSSSITVNTSQASNQSLSCICSAHWGPEPGLYNETIYKEFILGLSVPIMSAPGESEALSLGAIVGIAIGVVFIAVFAVVTCTVVICTIKKRKTKRRRPKRNKSQDYYENPDTIMDNLQSRQVHGSQNPYAVCTVNQNEAFQIDDDGGEYDVLGNPKPKPTPGPVPIYSHLNNAT